MEKENVTPEGNTEVSSATSAKDNSVDGLLENIQKLRKEKENYKLKASELENKLKITLDKELEQKEEWKTLAEQRTKEVESWKSKYELKEKLIHDSLKVDALKTELLKMGLDAKYFDIALKAVDLNTISIDTETNVVMGIDSAAKFLREKAAPLFANQVPNVSHAAPQGNFQALTLEDWEKLPQDDKIKRESELLKNLGMLTRP